MLHEAPHHHQEVASDCPVCCTKLKKPFINCVECKPNVQLCLRCFARGSEFGEHSNDHSYEIRQLSFSLFGDEKWSARDELHLLEELEDNGFGNWQGISKRLNKKSSKDVQNHYLKCYIEKPKDTLPKVTVDSRTFFRRSIDFQESQCPPRPGSSCPTEDELFSIGYMPARGDFSIESDNFAECDIKDVDFIQNQPAAVTASSTNSEEQDALMTEMNHHMMEMFYVRQRERNLKKTLVKKYGLLDVVTSSVFYTYGREERMVRDVMKKFTQFMEPLAHEKFVQGLLYQKSLESRIRRLQEYREHGLKTFKDAVFYEKLKRRRDRSKKFQTFRLDEVVPNQNNPLACQVWLHKQINKKKIFNLPFPNMSKKHVPPLDLKGLPCVDELTDGEKEICATIRMAPKDYLDNRTTLQEESFRSDGVRLAVARTLLKINVNNTKKLYDFMVDAGIIKGLQT